ncbi:carbonic anhydrase [Striga asiatica]|uniref:Carbonic anhydrase n=1 Tax=Striga asiatica TaxID=4170 RepID=A0A5A7Q580_STRAF|nr:carbonic anhydrase [Striga asiatica]
MIYICTLHFLQVYTAILYRSSWINRSLRCSDDSLSAISSREAAMPDPRRLCSSSARPSHISTCDSASDNSSSWPPKQLYQTAIFQNSFSSYDRLSVHPYLRSYEGSRKMLYEPLFANDSGCY